MANFPPTIKFPLAVDDDRTLFLVYNTTETTLSANNQAWSEEILITPVGADEAEIWPENGFATIEGELLYYDAVSKNGDDKVYKLKRCCRNIGGKPTQYNSIGTWIRGFVIAEHHNQIVSAIIKIEDFIGESFSEDEETLDWRIRHLQDEPLVFDDSTCPDVEFSFDIIDSNPNTGTLVQFSVNLNGGIGSVQVQFGDGSSTTQIFGTHQYAPNAVIDPAVIVSNGNCQIVQTPIAREETEEPTIRQTAPPFSVQIPINLGLPSFIFPSQQIPASDFVMPPIVFPCIDLNPILAALPSIISMIVHDIQIPSIISFTPVLNIPSTITFTPEISIPDTITFDNVPSFAPLEFDTPPTFDPITFDSSPTFPPITFDSPPTFPPIDFGTVPSFASINFGAIPSFASIGFGAVPSFASIVFAPTPSFATIEFGVAPVVSVNWGTPPTLSYIVSLSCPSGGGGGMAAAANYKSEDDSVVELQYDFVGFPTEIKIIPPVIAPIEIKHDIPSIINLFVPTFENIRIIGPENPIPSEIKIASFSLPDIKFDTSSMPLSIPVTFPDTLPMISFDTRGIPENIKVVGIPETIKVQHDMPSLIQVVVPEGLKIPLVFEGPPLTAELKIDWGFEKVSGDITDQMNCFRIIPCK